MGKKDITIQGENHTNKGSLHVRTEEMKNNGIHLSTGERRRKRTTQNSIYLKKCFNCNKIKAFSDKIRLTEFVTCQSAQGNLA